MRDTSYSWLGREFVYLTAEAAPGPDPEAALGRLFEQFELTLSGWGLRLDDTVRSRLWARDSASRDLGSRARLRFLARGARSASSSYIAPAHFDSPTSVGLDLWAMRPSQIGATKIVREYEPPIVPVRFVVYDSIVFLSGVTHEIGTLNEQLGMILPRIDESLKESGSGWEMVASVSCFLHCSQALAELKALLPKYAPVDLRRAEFSLVDGYSKPGKLIEIEVTATC
jgi:enamine deaminase RidA (YjgF/YER057c/UK114 family)